MRNKICALLLCAALTLLPGPGGEPRADKMWWGVLSENALRMARTDEAENNESETEEIIFVWPVWDWLQEILDL